MAEGFLGRWSQRKAQAREGKPLQEPARPAAPAVPVASATPAASTALAPHALPASAQTNAASTSPATQEPQQPPPPTMADVQSLNAESDYSPFVARNVEPDVRNAAMKKLFADPRYNVMDGMDIYIDDYSKPDPLPASMLRKMASAQFLKLVDGEPQTPAPTTGATAGKQAVEPDVVAQPPATPAADANAEANANANAAAASTPASAAEHLSLNEPKP